MLRFTIKPMSNLQVLHIAKRPACRVVPGSEPEMEKNVSYQAHLLAFETFAFTVIPPEKHLPGIHSTEMPKTSVTKSEREWVGNVKIYKELNQKYDLTPIGWDR